MNIRYYLGKLISDCGYRVTRDYRYPKVNGELLKLGFHLLNMSKSGKVRIMQIGAYDGQTCDPLQEILSNEEIVACLVEPQPQPFKSLKDLYAGNPRIMLVNGVVGQEDGKANLYVPSGTSSPMASTDPEHYKRFGFRGSESRPIEVASYSVKSLLQKCDWGDIDLLQVDTEGMDFKVLSYFFASGIRPMVINFESRHLSKQDSIAAQKLLDKSYIYIKGEQDTFGIHSSLIG